MKLQMKIWWFGVCSGSRIILGKSVLTPTLPHMGGVDASVFGY